MATRLKKSSKEAGQVKRLKILDEKTEKLKVSFIETLKKSPIVQVVCERTSVGRSTYYDWRKKDEVFARSADKALGVGQLFVNDMAESQLVRQIQNGKLTAIIFWLKNHHKSYNDKVVHEHEFDFRDITKEESEQISRALKNIGLASILKSNGDSRTPDEYISDQEKIDEDRKEKLRDGYSRKNIQESPPVIESKKLKPRMINLDEYMAGRKKRLGNK